MMAYSVKKHLEVKLRKKANGVPSLMMLPRALRFRGKREIGSEMTWGMIENQSNEVAGLSMPQLHTFTSPSSSVIGAVLISS